jgi:hypothetical protein
MQISITRGLTELKLLQNRIASTIQNATFVACAKKSSTKVNMTEKDQFIKDAVGSLQSVEDLIARRAKLKSAIVASNAVTLVTINGVDMTVAEAIELKTSIVYNKTLLATLEKQYRAALAVANRENEKAEEKLQVLLVTTLGKDAANRKDENALSIIKPFLDQNEVALVDPLSIAKVIDEISAYIMNFESEVDFVLSESNSITKIEI